MDAEDLLRDSDGAYDEAEDHKVKGSKKGAEKPNPKPEHEPEENRDYIDLGKDTEIETEENGVIEVHEKRQVSGQEQEMSTDSSETKTEVTSLDLHFLVRELRQRLIGGVFRKIYQYGGRDTKQMIFGFFIPGRPGRSSQRFQPGQEAGNGLGKEAGGRQLLLYIDNKKLFLTTKKEAAPQDPGSFCMFLRKHLMGKRVKDIIQHGFDRIIEMHTQDHAVIFELFSKGNVILCDRSYNIIMPMEVQRWRHREIRPKVPYKFPPSQANPLILNTGQFYRSIKESDKNIIATLASRLALGPIYAKELCKRAGVDGGKAAGSVSAEESSKLHSALLELDKSAPAPSIYPGMVAPFPLKSLGEMPRHASSFSDALDGFFSSQMLQVKKESARKTVEKKVKKVERIAEKQSEASKKWSRVAGESKEIADAIYNYYSTVEAVINGLRIAKDSGMSWDEIRQKMKAEASAEAESVKEIREGDGIVVMDLGGKEVEINFTKSVEDNAARYYEDSKWAKGKIKGAEAALEATGRRLEEMETKMEEAGSRDELQEEMAPAGEGTKEEPKKIKKRWYEYYRWFVSSDGLVVIAGKNAQQNENIIKKRLEPGDLVFHSDIQGAAFVLIKSAGKIIPQETIRQASEFSAAHSKAWAKGLGKIDVFAAKPDQVSKANEQGVNAPKGAFFISGERMWFKDVPIKLAIGVWINREEGWAKVIAGPLMPVRKLSQYFVTLRPGFTRPPELAASIRRNLLMKASPDDKFFIEHVPLEDFQGQIPSGMSDMIEGAGDF